MTSFSYPNTPYYIPTSSTVDISNVFTPSTPSPIIFTIIPSLSTPINTGLTLNSTTGRITGATSFTSILPLTTFTVYAAIYAGPTISTQFQLSINFTPGFYYPLSPYLIEKDTFEAIIPIYFVGNLTGIVYSQIGSPSLASIGLNLNTTDGSIQGTANTASSSTTYTIRANNNGVTYDTTLNIGVESLPIISYSQTTYILTQGIQVSILPSPVIGQTNVKYSISGCPLPANLAFNENTGEITGIPLLTSNFYDYVITITNTIGSSSTNLIISIIKEVLAPVVTGENANIMISAPDIAMRRKVEILKYKQNSAKLSKSQYFSLLVKGNGPYAKRVWSNQGDRDTNPNISGLPQVGNTLLCNSSTDIICTPTSSSDVPGPVMNLCYNPATPLVGYMQPNRKKTNIGFKWPQRGWSIGDMGFPRGKAGSILD